MKFGKFLWNSYFSRRHPASYSYAQPTNCDGAMRPLLRSQHSHLTQGSPDLSDSSPAPAVGEVMSEIGLLLAIHLAIATAVVLTLQAFGLD